MMVYCKQLHAHKFDNPDEMVQFLETHNLSILIKEEMEEILPILFILFRRQK